MWRAIYDKKLEWKLQLHQLSQQAVDHWCVWSLTWRSGAWPWLSASGTQCRLVL
jgi:hypothetical protein